MQGVRFHRLYMGLPSPILQAMKNREFKTKFWRDAASTLPARYKHDLQQAEQWELALDAVFEFVSRARATVFHTPSNAH